MLTRFPHVVLHLCGPDTCMAWHTAVELYRCSAAEAMQRSCQKKWLCRLAFRLVFLCLWYSAVVYSDSKNYHVLWNVSDIYLQFSRIQIAYFVPRWFSLGGLGFSLDIVSMIFVVDRLGIGYFYRTNFNAHFNMNMSALNRCSVQPPNRARIPDAVFVQLFLLKMGMSRPETCRG